MLRVLRMLSLGSEETFAHLPGVRELQADDIQHLWPMGTAEIFHKLAEFYFAVCLSGHINDIDDFIST